MSAHAETIQLTPEIAALVKGMLERGDKQSDIAACFLINGGRVAEINTGQRFENVPAAKADSLPPPGPYPSPYDLWRAGQEMWKTRVALEAALTAIQGALVAVHKAEQRR